MKKSFIAMLLIVGALAAIANAQTNFPKSISSRSQYMGVTMAQIGPCTDPIRVNVSSENWGRPDSIIVSGVYFSRYTNMKFKPTNGDTLSMPFDSLSGMLIAVDTIYKTGTDSLSRSGSIYIIGNKRF